MNSSSMFKMSSHNGRSVPYNQANTDRNTNYRSNYNGNFNDRRNNNNRSFNQNNSNRPNGFRPRSTFFPPPPADLPVHKNFYRESYKTSNRSQYEINQWLSANSVTTRGQGVLNPILDFDDLQGLPDGIMVSIQKQGFTTPTVIQSQAWPLALSGRDLVGIAQTGSGKTLSYALPALMHVEGNIHRRKHGPSVLVLAPTRELAQQIKEVFNTFRTRAVCVFGGASKIGQRREIENIQPSIIIACPGRLIDFVEESTITLQNISYLVLDEADRMLDMGFEPQIRKIVNRISQNRQTLMWSATWPKEVRKLAEDFLSQYVQINIGSISLAANHNITQIIDICEEHEKLDKLYKLLTSINGNNRENKSIIFCETKRKVDQISQQLKDAGWYASAIHGDKAQNERDWTMNNFKSGRTSILIATDVAARGLDVDDIKYVINFDYPGCSEDYVHRIGRTGRRDRKGTSYTFFTLNNAKQANDLIGVLKEANQQVPAKLYEIAQQSNRYGKNVRRRYNTGGFRSNFNSFGSNSGGFGNRNYGNNNGFNNNSHNNSWQSGNAGMKRKYDDSYNAGSTNGSRFDKKPNFGAGTHSTAINGNKDRFNNYA